MPRRPEPKPLAEYGPAQAALARALFPQLQGNQWEGRLWTRRKHGTYNWQVRSHGRILALDLGSKSIGLAVSDPLGLTAQGLPGLRRTNRRADSERLRELVDAYQVERIVVGHPLHLKGYAGTRALEAERFADRLRRELKLPVELFDERLTTAEAERLLDQVGGGPAAGGAGRRQSRPWRKKRKEAAHQIAASLVLQTYLDQQAARLREAQAPAPASSDP